MLYFNSHAHVERDRQFVDNTAVDVHFNSHAHVERDSSGVALYSLSKISTHTLTWSVTIGIGVDAAIIYISTHTLTWSVTLQLFIYAFLAKFQLTRSRGA